VIGVICVPTAAICVMIGEIGVLTGMTYIATADRVGEVSF